MYDSKLNNKLLQIRYQIHEYVLFELWSSFPHFQLLAGMTGIFNICFLARLLQQTSICFDMAGGFEYDVIQKPINCFEYDI